MNLRGARDRNEPEINFIPLIDVLLVILIFLMVTTTYQRVAELQITLPEADAEQPKQRPKEINVGVDAQGRYVINKTCSRIRPPPRWPTRSRRPRATPRIRSSSSAPTRRPPTSR
jgi:biopolymer transport protein ExbD